MTSEYGTCDTCGTCCTQLCSCQRNGLKCVDACGDFRGEGCNNVEKIEIEIDNELIDTD